MKPKQNQSSTQQQISEFQAMKLHKPNPPTPEMVERAKFVDKTHIWKHARIRSGD
jgi:hypothetical protein